jgi:hypothetical protein
LSHPKPAQAQERYRPAEPESGDISNRDFGFEMDLTAFKINTARFEVSWMADRSLQAPRGSDGSGRTDLALD